VFKKASKPLAWKEKRKYFYMLKAMFIMVMIANVYLIFDMEIRNWQFERDHRDNMRSMVIRCNQRMIVCLSTFWMLNSLSEFAMIFIFLCIMCKI
jgi:hypothetical protein